MSERYATSYGRDLLLEFVPGNARAASRGRGLALMSGQVLAEVAIALEGHTVEVTYPGEAILRGVFAAAKQEDAVLTVACPAGANDGPAALRQQVERVLDAAHASGFDRPFCILRRAEPLGALDDGDMEREAERLYNLIDAGFTAVAFRPQDISVDRLARFLSAAAPLWQNGLGVEVELDDFDPQSALMMLELDQSGVALSGVRGANDGDELCGGFYVADPTLGEVPDDVPLRLSTDAFVLKTVLNVFSRAEVQAVLGEDDHSTDAAVSALVPMLEESGLGGLLEAKAYAYFAPALRTLGADHSATDVLDALAEAFFQGAAGAR